MSGQSKVEESTVAAPANASAPATKRPPVVRRIPSLGIVVVIASPPGRRTRFVRRTGTLYPEPCDVNGDGRHLGTSQTTAFRTSPGPHGGRHPRRGVVPARRRWRERGLDPRHRGEGRRGSERGLHVLPGQGRGGQGARRA